MGEHRFAPLDWEDDFPFGKYGPEKRGLTVKEIYKSDPGYLIFCRDKLKTHFSLDVKAALRNHEDGI